MAKRDMRSLRQRLIVTVALVISAGLAATTFLVWRTVADSVTREFDSRLSRALSEIETAVEFGSDGILVLGPGPSLAAFNVPYSGWYWSIARGETVLARSRSLVLASLPPSDSGDRVVDSIVGGPDGKTLRIHYKAVAVQRDDITLHVAAAGPADEISRDIWQSMRPLIAVMTIAGLVIVGLIGVIIRQGLKPLEVLAQDIERVAGGDSSPLPASSYRELVPLTAGINNLIGQVEATVTRARTQVANLAHAIKTPLSLLSARNEVGGVLGDADIAVSIDTINRHVDHHLRRARIAARVGLASDVVSLRDVIDDVVMVVRGGFRARDLVWHIDVDRALLLAGEREDFEEMFGNLVENACKWARGTVDIKGSIDGAQIGLSIEDDGRGVPEALQQQIMLRGERLDENVPGSGLGLAIADEIARLYGGSLSLKPSSLGGLCAEVHLLAATGQVRE